MILKKLSYMLLLILCLLLQGCSIPLSITYHNPQRFFIRLKDSKQVIIKAIAKEGRIPESEAMTLWERYKVSEYKSFINYLIQVNPHEKTEMTYRNFLYNVKARTKILKRGYYEKIK